MQTFLKWLLVSSADSTKWSMTMKGVLVSGATVLTIILGLANIQVGDLTPFIDSMIQTVQALAVFVSSVAAVFGIGRKIWRTISGTHAAIHDVE